MATITFQRLAVAIPRSRAKRFLPRPSRSSAPRLPSREQSSTSRTRVFTPSHGLASDDRHLIQHNESMCCWTWNCMQPSQSCLLGWMRPCSARHHQSQGAEAAPPHHHPGPPLLVHPLQTQRLARDSLLHLTLRPIPKKGGCELDSLEGNVII